MTGLTIAAIVVAAFIILIIVIVKALNNRGSKSRSSTDWSWIFEPPERRAGRRGEEKATSIIRAVLKEGDHLFTNVQVSYDEKEAELDNVIVNKYGVFIIEVKNYNGRLSGDEDDYEWVKYHTTDAGNTYTKMVKNPIRQVKRQVYILAKFLECSTPLRVWVEGYALLLNRNSPVESKYILSSLEDIDHAIHTFQRNRLTQKDIDEISQLMAS